MTREDDFIGQLEGYFDEYEGMTALPDAVRDAVRAQLPMTKQLGRFSGPTRRFPVMNNNIARLGLAAAVIVLAVLVGIQFLPGPNVGSDASPTPTGTPLALHGGQLEPGTYLVSNVDAPVRTPVSFTFTVPAGWIARAEDFYVSKKADTPGELGFVPWVVTHVYTDACHSEGALNEVGPTVDDLVTALVDQVNSDATTPVDVEVGGYPAKFIRMSVPTDLDASTCRNPELLIQIWANQIESDYFAIPVGTDLHADAVSDVYIVDVNGERVVLLAGHDPESSAADVAELDSIIGSIRFEQ